MPCRVIEGIDDERAVTLLHAANYFTRALTVTEALRGDAVRLRSEDPSLSGMRVDDVKAAIIERQTGRKVSGKTIAREERLARRIAEDLSPEWAAEADRGNLSAEAVRSLAGMPKERQAEMHASSAPNIALVDAMSLTWLLLMLLVMVVLELLSSRGSLACPAAGGSRGGRRRHFLPLLDPMYASTDALETRSFLPSLYESISPDQMRSYALFRLALMYSCISITVIHSSRSWLPSGAAHSAVRAMVPPIFPCGTVRARRAAPCAFSSARRLNRLMSIGEHGASGDGSRWVELVGPPRNGHEPRALARSYVPEK